MHSLFFITGNHPRLSQAEISSVLKTNELVKTGNCVMGNLATLPDFEVIQNTLGGTVKIGVIIAQTTWDTIENEAYSYIQKTLPQNQKIYFGISVYNSLCDIKKLGLRLKQKFAKESIKSRWVESRGETLSAVVVKTNKLLSLRGVEFVIIQMDAKLLLGVTKTVQPFDEFSTRDYGRPNRDAAGGMLPPKVAKIMINLARIKKDDALLDPFCGSGTILQEAALMGYTNVSGSDISKKAIADTKANLQWLHSLYPRLPSPALYETPVASLPQIVTSHSINAIVTEPYLGPPLGDKEPEEKIARIIQELTLLYIESFMAFKKVLAPDGKIVIVAPIIKTKRLPILTKIQSLGFVQDKMFAHLYDDEARQSFVYGRSEQKVWREIFIFTLNHT